uniref:ATPase ASNA1 homolog n=1 Tax=Rhizochromulina marina TaxID=1034831 RepID=A0A7S2SEK5_9STRA|mmetsp:Transcript_29059/g.84860  ORF Transcript_29059/g.84860 Transcript_29059/m.84860 type:complete len:360 (+) Transcript_29059:21-1100(+)
MAEADDGAQNLEALSPSLRNVVEQDTLQWIFVGGKGGVGKTTTSCCLAIQLAKVRQKVLVVSTDPAHNLSDAFAQKFSKEPTQVNGFENLFCMEIDPDVEVDELAELNGSAAGGAMGGIQKLMQDLTQAIPGIDEAMSFAELMKQVQTMDYDVIVFDTAPTGHTLRLLSFPTMLGKAFDKIMALKNSFGGLLSQFSSMMGSQMPSEEMLLGRLEQTREVIERVNLTFKDPTKTTFVCVCIPEFLSLYETERLVQELTKFDIDTHNVVVNQVLFPDKDAQELSEWYTTEEPKLSPEARELLGKLLARKRMQDKYVNQIWDLYEDFHVVLMPLLNHEVRGSDKLRAFSEHLVEEEEDEEEG